MRLNTIKKACEEPFVQHFFRDKSLAKMFFFINTDKNTNMVGEQTILHD